MYLLFMDESGNPSLHCKNVSAEPCVIAGLAIPDGAWKPIDDAFRLIKANFHVAGELKWRHFAPKSKGPLVHLDAAQRDRLRRQVYGLLASRNAVRIVAVIGTPKAYEAMGAFRSAPDGFYTHALKALSERFQYFLQDITRETATPHNGLLVCDARERSKDQRLVEAMHDLMMGGDFVSNYANLVEGLFMADSRLSTGIQLADLVAGAIWHNEARGKDTWFKLVEPRIRRSPTGDTKGYGIVRI